MAVEYLGAVQVGLQPEEQRRHPVAPSLGPLVRRELIGGKDGAGHHFFIIRRTRRSGKPVHSLAVLRCQSRLLCTPGQAGSALPSYHSVLFRFFRTNEMNEIQMLIGGQQRAASNGATFERRNPLDHSVAIILSNNEKVLVTGENISSLLKKIENQNDRKLVFNSLFDLYKKKKILASIYNAIVQRGLATAKLEIMKTS